jgi:hypothetical protein
VVGGGDARRGKHAVFIDKQLSEAKTMVFPLFSLQLIIE